MNLNFSSLFNFKVQINKNSSFNIYGFVRYVHPQSPADENGIKRGDIFIGINNTILNIDNYLDLLNLDSYYVNFANYLDTNKINNRMLFGGNLLRQPVAIQQEKDYPGSIRKKDNNDYSGADQIMNSSLFIGTFPGFISPSCVNDLPTILPV